MISVCIGCLNKTFYRIFIFTERFPEINLNKKSIYRLSTGDSSESFMKYVKQQSKSILSI